MTPAEPHEEQEVMKRRSPDKEGRAPNQPRGTHRVGWLRRQFADVTLVARRDKRWWLLPLVFVLLLLAGLMLIATALGPLAPFVYPFL